MSPIMNVQASGVRQNVMLPSLDLVTQPKIRDAVAAAVDTEQRIRTGFDIDGRVKAGHPLDELSADEIAAGITAAREANGLRAGAEQQLQAAIDEYLGEWIEGTQARKAKVAAQVLKTAKATLAALEEFELIAGMAQMLADHPARLSWKAPREGLEVGTAATALRAVIDRLSAGEQQ